MKNDKNFLLDSPFGWSFYDSSITYPALELLENKTTLPPSQVVDDVRTLLEILAKHRLFFPTYMILNKRIEITNPDPNSFCEELEKILQREKGQVSIEKIGGYGYASREEGEVTINDLVTIEDIRFCDRQFSIETHQNVWFPFEFNEVYKPAWQIDYFEKNRSRLRDALKEVDENFNMEVEPERDEIDKDGADGTVWIKNFQVYLNPDLLASELEENPPMQEFDYKNYLNNLL